MSIFYLLGEHFCFQTPSTDFPTIPSKFRGNNFQFFGAFFYFWQNRNQINKIIKQKNISKLKKRLLCSKDCEFHHK